jgi:hypothetical protein
MNLRIRDATAADQEFLARGNEAMALETYFIRHGASTHLMSALFKVRRKLTLKRRRDFDARRPAGRVRLPDYATRERVYQAWRANADPTITASAPQANALHMSPPEDMPPSVMIGTYFFFFL